LADRLRINKKWLLLFIILSGVLAALIWKYVPHSAIADDAAALAWGYGAKVLFLGASVSGVALSVLFFALRRSALLPYIETFSRFRFLLWQLIQRDFKSKYKRSVLGILWTLLNPLLTMIVLTIVFSNLFRFDIPNFPVYLLSGQIIFGFFSEATNASMISVIAGGGMIKKVYIPKYILPLSRVLSSLVNLLLSLLAFLLVVCITGAPVHWTMALLPVPLFYVFLFSLGVGMLLSAATVFFRDLSYLYGIILTAWTYLTPIFYPATILPENLRFVLALNPMAHFIQYFRNVALYGRLPNLWQNIVCLSCGCVALLLGTYAFMRNQDQFILYI
jgi:ABC-type polysaccharide/polyol phosphate export permease